MFSRPWGIVARNIDNRVSLPGKYILIDISPSTLVCHSVPQYSSYISSTFSIQHAKNLGGRIFGHSKVGISLVDNACLFNTSYKCI